MLQVNGLLFCILHRMQSNGITAHQCETVCRNEKIGFYYLSRERDDGGGGGWWDDNMCFNGIV